MEEVTIRELRNHGGEVVERVARGETLTVTCGGVPVAYLRPVPRAPLKASALLANRRHLPHVDPVKLRADIDAVIDPAL